jgi:hypothetical protein
MINKNKLYPNNSNKSHYRGWLFLGSDDQCDYYMVKSKYAFNQSKIWLSIVYSNEPSDYASPCYDNLIKLDSHAMREYNTMIRLIKDVKISDLPMYN